LSPSSELLGYFQFSHRENPSMKLRFSLRALMLLIAAVAVFGYWRSRPAAIARELQQTIAAEDYTAADSLMIGSRDRDFQRWAAGDGQVKVRVAFEPQSTWGWLCGQCPGEFSASVTTPEVLIWQPGQPVASTAGIRMSHCRETTARVGEF